MAIAFVKHVGSAEHKTGASTIVVTVPAGGCAVDNTVVVHAAIDFNSPSQNSVTDSRGNTYTRQVSANTTGGGDAAWAQIFTSLITTALQQGDSITFTMTDPVSAKAVSVDEYSGVSATRLAFNGTGQQAGSTPSTSVTVTENAEILLLGVTSVEGPSEDVFTSESANFTTRTRIGTTGSGAASNITNNPANRIATNSGSTVYTYAPTLGTARDNAIALIAMQAVVVDPLNQSNTEAVGMVDAHTVVLVSDRSQSDNLGLLDSVTALSPLSATVTDSLGALDARTQAATYAQTVTDALGITDAASTAGVFNASFLDLENLLDSTAPALTMARGPPDDPIGLLDASSKTVGKTVQRPLSQVGTF